MTGPRRILVAGYYGAKNAGDEAILSGLLASFRDADFTGGFTSSSVGEACSTTTGASIRPRS